MGQRYFWVLNLDAELELEQFPHPFTRPQAIQARIEALWPALGALVGAGVVEGPGARGEGLEGRAWCPTPGAQRLLGTYGATLAPAPRPEVLRWVNHRRFSFELGANLEGSGYFTELGALRAHLETQPPDWPWLVKRPLSFAGRGRRRMCLSRLSEADTNYLRSSLQGGEGLLVEPWIERSRDYAIHGQLAADGTAVYGAPTVQRIDEHGAWQGSQIAGPAELPAEERALLLAEAERVARALSAAGYFGPFNLDAFAGRDPNGRSVFQPRCEINARYSMGYPVGMGGVIA